MENFNWNKIPFAQFYEHCNKTGKQIKQNFQMFFVRKYRVLSSSHYSIFEDGLYKVVKRKDLDSAMKQILCIDCAILA